MVLHLKSNKMSKIVWEEKKNRKKKVKIAKKSKLDFNYQV